MIAEAQKVSVWFMYLLGDTMDFLPEGVSVVLEDGTTVTTTQEIEEGVAVLSAEVYAGVEFTFKFAGVENYTVTCESFGTAEPCENVSCSEDGWWTIVAEPMNEDSMLL